MALLVTLPGCTTTKKLEAPHMQVYALSNPNTDEATQKVYAYLCSLGGAHTLSAQQESTWM